MIAIVLIAALALAGVAAPGASGQAQAGTPPQKSQPQKEARPQASPDESFIASAAQGNLFQIQAGTIAAKRSTNPQVIKFAETTVGDATQANLQLQSLAAVKGFKLPEQPTDQDRKKLQQLQSAAAADFDSRYMGLVAAADELAEKDFRRYSELKDADLDLKDWAKAKVPALRKQTIAAKNLSAQLSREEVAAKKK